LTLWLHTVIIEVFTEQVLYKVESLSTVIACTGKHQHHTAGTSAHMKWEVIHNGDMEMRHLWIKWMGHLWLNGWSIYGL